MKLFIAIALFMISVSKIAAQSEYEKLKSLFVAKEMADDINASKMKALEFSFVELDDNKRGNIYLDGETFVTTATNWLNNRFSIAVEELADDIYIEDPKEKIRSSIKTFYILSDMAIFVILVDEIGAKNRELAVSKVYVAAKYNQNLLYKNEYPEGSFGAKYGEAFSASVGSKEKVNIRLFALEEIKKEMDKFWPVIDKYYAVKKEERAEQGKKTDAYAENLRNESLNQVKTYKEEYNILPFNETFENLSALGQPKMVAFCTNGSYFKARKNEIIESGGTIKGSFENNQTPMQYNGPGLPVEIEILKNDKEGYDYLSVKFEGEVNLNFENFQNFANFNKSYYFPYLGKDKKNTSNSYYNAYFFMNGNLIYYNKKNQSSGQKPLIIVYAYPGAKEFDYTNDSWINKISNYITTVLPLVQSYDSKLVKW